MSTGLFSKSQLDIIHFRLIYVFAVHLQCTIQEAKSKASKLKRFKELSFTQMEINKVFILVPISHPCSSFVNILHSDREGKLRYSPLFFFFFISMQNLYY